MGTLGSAGRWLVGGRRQRHLVVGVVGGGGDGGGHGHHRRRRQEHQPARATTRPSPCIPRLPRGVPWSLLIAHTRGTPMGARGKSYTHVANPPSQPGAPQRRAATPPPPPTTPQTPPRRHLLAPHAYPEVPWDPFPRPTCVGHAWAGMGKHRDSYGA